MAHRTLSALIDDLPERCARIVRLRKIEGLSQKQIAVQLGTTEKAFEKQVWLGVRLLREAGRERVTAILQRHGIRTSTYVYSQAPHDFWLFQPYLDQAVAQIAAFLMSVDADLKRKPRT